MRGFNPRILCLWISYHVPAQSLSLKCKLAVPSKLRPQIDETFEGVAGAGNQILFDRVLALLTYLINLRDTLVIASGHINWGFPVPGEKSGAGCLAVPRSLYFPKLFAQNTAPVVARLALLCVKDELCCVMIAFTKVLIGLVKYILINYLRSGSARSAK
jgi:hypothetical protein